MKKLHLFLAILVVAFVAGCSEQPIRPYQGGPFTYQGVAHDANGVLLTNTTVKAEFVISEEIENKFVPIYTETQDVNIGSNGIYTVKIGAQSEDTARYAKIQWGYNLYNITAIINYDTATFALYTLPDTIKISYCEEIQDIKRAEMLADAEAKSAAEIEERERLFAPQTDDGALYGEFSVAPDRKVRFSQGNLQYKPSTATWRFALHQYDFVGEDNCNISADYDGWIDLFGWGTSGYSGRLPYTIDSVHGQYGPGDGTDLTGWNYRYDWGSNRISNGGDAYNAWRTLTRDEWVYLFSREDKEHNLKFAVACISNSNGVILLPDDWTMPEDLYPLKLGLNRAEVIEDYGYSRYNDYSAGEWFEMEKAGAVFLPASGFRSSGTVIKNVNDLGTYWSSTAENRSSAFVIFFAPETVRANVPSGDLFSGFAVRLVRDK